MATFDSARKRLGTGQSYRAYWQSLAVLKKVWVLVNQRDIGRFANIGRYSNHWSIASYCGTGNLWRAGDLLGVLMIFGGASNCLGRVLATF